MNFKHTGGLKVRITSKHGVLFLGSSAVLVGGTVGVLSSFLSNGGTINTYNNGLFSTGYLPARSFAHVFPKVV